jgi:hypothetical protein
MIKQAGEGEARFRRHRAGGLPARMSSAPRQEESDFVPQRALDNRLMLTGVALPQIARWMDLLATGCVYYTCSRNEPLYERELHPLFDMNSKLVLFLCTANYYRSRFAEIMFNYCPPKASRMGGGVAWAGARAWRRQRRTDLTPCAGGP